MSVGLLLEAASLQFFILKVHTEKESFTFTVSVKLVAATGILMAKLNLKKKNQNPKIHFIVEIPTI